MGFAVISINTPLCILLSCDPATERTVKSLPGGVKAFCVPYVLFLLVSVSVTYTIYLISWQLQIGGVGVKHLIVGAFLAVLGSILNVMMEWFWPIRGFSIESDLWHHPRKYVVPTILLLIGVAVSVI